MPRVGDGERPHLLLWRRADFRLGVPTLWARQAVHAARTANTSAANRSGSKPTAAITAAIATTTLAASSTTAALTAAITATVATTPLTTAAVTTSVSSAATAASALASSAPIDATAAICPTQSSRTTA